MGVEQEYLACQVCGKQNETVRTRNCAYYLDIWDEEREETVCDDCEYKHKCEI